MVDKEDISEMRDSKEYPDDEIDPGKEQAINDLKERYDMLKEDTWNMTGVAAISVEHHQQEYEKVLQEAEVRDGLKGDAEMLGVQLSDFGDDDEDEEDADWDDAPEMETVLDEIDDDNEDDDILEA
jgi:hypothetical protein